MAVERESKNNLVFSVNGERFELSTVDPSTTLLEFLRTRTRFKGVKLSCGEGGCGACVVLLSKYDPVLDQVEDFTASSCLTLLCSINGCSITTTEGLGNSRDGFHPIHQRFAGFHASQCGFCTPGMCVSLFAGLVNAEKTNRPEPSPGFSKLTVSEAERAISGNLCRCTGYRSIADACKSFAADVDMEDLGLNTFWRKGESKEVKMSRLPFYNRNKEICTFPEFLKKEIRSSMLLDSKRFYWYNPVSVKELQSLLESNETNDGSLIKLVAGNTAMGYYKELERYDRYIDLRYIPELSSIRRDPKGIEIGATITISKAIEALKKENKGEFHPKSVMVFKKIADHMEKIASGFIRNTASFGGNLVMAQRKNFPSDIATILLAVGSVVYIMTGPRCEKIMLEKFLERPPLDSKTVLLKVKIPSWESIKNISSESDTMLLFETYRAAPRPLGNALPYLNAAFLAEVSPCKTSDGIMVNNCQLAFGVYGTKHAIRARQVEEFLAGKILSFGVLYEATKLVRAIVVPEYGTSSPAYRSSLAVGFLFDFFSPLIDNGGEISNGLLEGYIKNVKAYKINQNHVQLAHDNIPSLLSSSKQVFELSTEYHPVGEPITKSGAAIQASGEALYVDDIPSPANCLHGAFIYSTKPLAWVKGIKFQPKPHPDGVAGIITFKDIPKGGENIGSKTIFGAELLFAEELTQCAGQRLAFVVADTQKHADTAIKFAVVDYDLENLEPPILYVEEAVKRSSLFEVPPMFYPKQVGDIAKGMAEADHKILSAEMKTTAWWFISSSQVPEKTHTVIARCLGIPEHNVRVITRRVGGGFGGKAIKAMPVATACALAAHKLRCPVRIYLDRKTDMIMAGGRHPMKITYSVGFKSNGKITALQLDILINAGLSVDISPIMPHNMMCALKKYDWGALSFDIKSNADEPLEYTLPSIWDKLAMSSSLHRRTEMVKEFNRDNTWRKRGISRLPIVHEVLVRPTPGKVSVLSDGSIVVEVGGIELGQGLWTKVQQMAAFALSSIQCNGVGDLLDKVRVIQSDSLSLIQGGFTAGSTTSESSCEAVRLCCNILVERLRPLKERLQDQMGFINWDMLIDQAHIQSVNLSASSYFVPDLTSMQYRNYGAAMSQASLPLTPYCITRETTILQTDIIYDCGQSLNPAVDLGQIEGAFVQGLGFFMLEEYLTNSDGLMVSEASGEPPLLLAASVHCATRAAIKEARKQLLAWSGKDESCSTFQLEVPATMPVVKEHCGLESVERRLKLEFGMVVEPDYGDTGWLRLVLPDYGDTGWLRLVLPDYGDTGWLRLVLPKCVEELNDWELE
uniref:indole-3-acetaldehyde oxidase n=1 Tax=Fagus sylvatica TaxID=28930 RepID=A0A2N9ECF9_FAGSY